MTARTGIFHKKHAPDLALRLMNSISSCLVFYRYTKWADPFKTFLELRAGEELPEPSRGTVLLLPICIPPTLSLFEGYIGYAMRLRGYRVKALFCGQAVGSCENFNVSSLKAPSCALCMAEQPRFARAFGVEPLWYRDCIGEDLHAALNDFAEKIDRADFFNFTYKGVKAGKCVLNSVCRHLLTSTVDINENEELIRNYIFTTTVSIEVGLGIVEGNRPVAVLGSHGIYSTWGAVMDTLIAASVPVATWIRGYVGRGNVLASHNGSHLLETIHEPEANWKDLVLTSSQLGKLEEYFSSKRDPGGKVDYVNYYGELDKTIGGSDIYGELNLSPDRVRIGLFPNIPWDGRTFASTREFPDMDTFAMAILDWLKAHPEVDLIIRAHPAEAIRKGSLSRERFRDILAKNWGPELPPNARYLGPDSKITSYQVATSCRAALLYTSTLSLELSFAGIPVIQVGTNNASNKGVVFDAPTRKRMFFLLDSAVGAGLEISTDMRERVRKYAYHWLYRRHFPETVVNLENLRFKSFRISSWKDLLPGANPVIDWFIDRFIQSEPFIYDE